MQLWQILILAIIQGIAEFLPISSSGHVVIVAELLAGDSGTNLDVSDVNIVLHVGTLFSILVVYWRRVVGLLTEDRRTIGLLIVGTVPGVLVGVPVKKFASGVLENPLLAGALLIVTGAMLVWISRRRPGKQEYGSLGYGKALLIGTAQAAAVLPGLSRSGATISAGLRLGLSPASATTFSFLLAIPIIAGGGAYELLSMLRHHEATATPPAYLALGALVAFLVGLASLSWLIRCVERGRLQWFAAWCIPVGILVVLWQLFFATPSSSTLHWAVSPVENTSTAAADGQGADGQRVDWAELGLELVRKDERDWQKAWLDERDRRLAAEVELERLLEQSPSTSQRADTSTTVDAPSPPSRRSGTPSNRGSPDALAERGNAMFYRGSNMRTGYAGGGEPLDLKLFWNYGDPQTAFLASPLVVDNAVYAASCTMDPAGNCGSVVCLDAETGQERWVSESPGDAAIGSERAWRAFFSSPALSEDGGSLVIGQGLHTDEGCQLICLDAHTGRVRWLVPTPLHIEGSPAIEGDIVVVGAGAVEGPDRRPTGDPGFVFTVRISDGQLLWKHPVVDPESSPAIADGIVYIGSGLNGNAVVALRTPTDEELQQQNLPRELWRTSTPYPATGAITLVDDLVLVGCGNSNFIFTSPEPKAAICALDRESGRTLWRVEMPETVLGPIAVRDGIAICCALNGEMLALDLRSSGRALWRSAIRDGSMLKAGAAFTGNHIYVATHDGHLVVLDASDGTVLEDHRLNAPNAPGAMGLSVSSPFVSGGCTYVGSETGGLRCFVGQDVR